MLSKPRVFFVWVCGSNKVLSVLFTTQADQKEERGKQAGGSLADDVHLHLLHQLRHMGQKPVHEMQSVLRAGKHRSCGSGEITQVSCAKNACCSRL